MQSPRPREKVASEQPTSVLLVSANSPDPGARAKKSMTPGEREAVSMFQRGVRNETEGEL